MKKLEKITSSNYRQEIIKNPGGFCSLFDIKKLKYKDPILLSSTDGVGTKLKLALEFNKLDYLGIDLVAMCVNDILANGGEPIFFLDYYSSSKVCDSNFLKIIDSINKGCKESGCSLIGGETAEMPGIYNKTDFDLAGFAVGVVERKQLINKDNVENGSILIGLESSGFHSNGFSLIRKALKEKKLSLHSKTPYKSSKKKLGDDLLIPTKIYVNEILPLIKKNLISSIAHITGGGIYENLSRAIPKNLKGIIDLNDFNIPTRFLWLKEKIKASEKQMLETFNCGIGMILVINKVKKKKVLEFLLKNKINFKVIGNVAEKKKSKSNVSIKNFGEWHIK